MLIRNGSVEVPELSYMVSVLQYLLLTLDVQLLCLEQPASVSVLCQEETLSVAVIHLVVVAELYRSLVLFILNFPPLF